jgi:hypothetical protein
MLRKKNHEPREPSQTLTKKYRSSREFVLLFVFFVEFVVKFLQFRSLLRTMRFQFGILAHLRVFRASRGLIFIVAA